MIGINRKDIQAILKAGAKAKGMSTSEFKAEIQATIDNIINSSDIEEQNVLNNTLGTEYLHQRNIFIRLQKRQRLNFKYSSTDILNMVTKSWNN